MCHLKVLLEACVIFIQAQVQAWHLHSKKLKQAFFQRYACYGLTISMVVLLRPRLHENAALVNEYFSVRLRTVYTKSD